MSRLVLAPHNDDEVLFTSFTIQREKPVACVVFDSYVQPERGAHNCTAQRRRTETIAAMAHLGLPEVRFLGFHDNAFDAAELIEALQQFGQPEEVFAPAIEEGGHVQHNLIGHLADKIFRNVRHYLTYTNRGKSVGIPVPFEPQWLINKFRALACYETQICHPANTEHFLRDQREYYQC